MAGIIARSMILCWFTEMNLSILLPTSKTAKSKRALMWSRLVCIALSAILASDSIEPNIRIENALAKIREIRSSN